MILKVKIIMILIVIQNENLILEVLKVRNPRKSLAIDRDPLPNDKI